MTDVMTTTLVMTTVEGPGVVALGGNEDVWTDGKSTVEETPVDSEVEDPLGKLDDAPPPPLLELGPTGEYDGGAEYWRGRTCFGKFTEQTCQQLSIFEC